MNNADEDLLQRLVAEGLLNKDTATRIKAVRAVDRALSENTKFSICIAVLVLMCATGVGVFSTEWLPAGVCEFSKVIAFASGIGASVVAFGWMITLMEKAQ